MIEEEKTVVVSRKCARRIRAGHPWGFRGEIRKRTGHPKAGEVVRILDEKGRPLCWGFYSPKPLIALRALSREEAPPGEDFWAQRIKHAAALRHALISDDTDAYRVVYSEADGIPGLVADKYGDYLVVQALTAGVEAHWEPIMQALIETWQPKGILARNDQKVRELEGMDQHIAVRYGEIPDTLVVRENGISFSVSPFEGQKTGAYLDQRETRLAMREYAQGRVLDAFSYQGWFALNMAQGADEVIALDGSAPALEVLERNIELGGYDNVSTVHDNAFKWLRAAAKRGEQFDVVFLDPPAFCKNRRTIEDGMRGYKEVNLRGMRLLKPGGILVTSSCSFHLSEALFEGVLEQAAADAKRTFQILDRRGQGRDHPRLLGHPESYYLKTFVLRVL